MIAALKQWLMEVIAVSILCASADSLMPQGGVKKVGQLVCGLVMLCVMVQPLAALGGTELTALLEAYSGAVHQTETQLEEQGAQTQKTVIEDHCAAYISDKAAQLGLLCRVEVECARHEDGIYLPVQARLWGAFTDVTQSRLTELLERELGIPAGEQAYYLTEEAAE